MKKLVFAAVAAIALTASVSFVSCNETKNNALDSLAAAIDSAATVIDSAAAVVDSAAAVVDSAAAVVE